jgi:hypothetical protein
MCAFKMLSIAEITRHLWQMNEWVWSKDGRIKKTKVLREKPAPMPLCPPQIPRGLVSS